MPPQGHVFRVLLHSLGKYSLSILILYLKGWTQEPRASGLAPLSEVLVGIVAVSLRKAARMKHIHRCPAFKMAPHSMAMTNYWVYLP